MSMRDIIAAARITAEPVKDGGGNIFEFCFGPEEPLFAGHFPNRPLLPGIFQLEMARMVAEWALDCPLCIREVSKAKFLHPITPGQIVRLNLKVTENNELLQARASFSVAGRPAGETLLTLHRSTGNVSHERPD